MSDCASPETNNALLVKNALLQTDAAALMQADHDLLVAIGVKLGITA